MRHNFLLSLLLLLILVPSSMALSLWSPCVSLTKADIEARLGKAVPCRHQNEGWECFGDRDDFPIKLQIDASGAIKEMTMRHSCNGIGSLRRKLDKLIPQESRGKLSEKSGPILANCDVRYTETYECLTIEYWEFACQGCAPASVTVTWK